MNDNNKTQESTRRPTLLIWDGDGGLFRASWSHRDSQNLASLLSAKKKLDTEMETILEKVNPDYYLIFHGQPGSKCFRYDVATLKPYKDSRNNRSDTWAEYFKKPLKEHLRTKWNSYPVADLECDDACSIALMKYKNEYDIIMVYEDHDFYQLADMADQDIRGYNPNKKMYTYLSKEVSRYDFWKLCLTGCSGDSAPGLPGIGGHYAEIGRGGNIIQSLEIGKADKILDTRISDSNEDYFECVRQAYETKYGALYLPFLIEQYILLRMGDKERFDFPKNIVLQKYEKKQDSKHNNLIDI